MIKLIGGLPLKQVLAMAPEWATHVSTADPVPLAVLYESPEHYQALIYGVMCGKCEQSAKGMDRSAKPISMLLEQLNSE